MLVYPMIDLYFSPSGLKFLHGAKKFSNKKITPEMYCKDPRYLMITLMRAERAWAYALDLKQFANTEPRKQVQDIKLP